MISGFPWRFTLTQRGWERGHPGRSFLGCGLEARAPAEACAPVRPIFGAEAQPCRNRVHFNVIDGAREVLRIANEAVEKGFGKRIGQAEGNSLREGSAVKVGRIAPGMPSFGRLRVWASGSAAILAALVSLPFLDAGWKPALQNKKAPRWIGAPESGRKARPYA